MKCKVCGRIYNENESDAVDKNKFCCAACETLYLGKPAEDPAVIKAKKEAEAERRKQEKLLRQKEEQIRKQEKIRKQKEEQLKKAEEARKQKEAELQQQQAALAAAEEEKERKAREALAKKAWHTGIINTTQNNTQQTKKSSIFNRDAPFWSSYGDYFCYAFMFVPFLYWLVWSDWGIVFGFIIGFIYFMIIAFIASIFENFHWNTLICCLIAVLLLDLPLSFFFWDGITGIISLLFAALPTVVLLALGLLLRNLILNYKLAGLVYKGLCIANFLLPVIGYFKEVFYYEPILDMILN